MLYIILHILLGNFLVLYVTNIDKPRNMRLFQYKPENKVVFITANVAILFFSFLFLLYVPTYLLSFLVRVSIMFCAFLMLDVGLYFINYSESLSRVTAVFLKIVTFILSFILVLVKIKNVDFSYEDGITLEAAPVFPSLPELEWLNWLVLGILFFVVFVPFVCAIIMVVQLARKRKFGALRQAMLDILSLLIPWAGVYFIYRYVIDSYPLSPVMLFMMLTGIESLMMKRTQRMDLNAVHFTFFVANIAQYVVPAIITAFVYKELHGVYDMNVGVFYVLLCLLVLLILFGTNIAGEFIINWRRSDNKKHMDRFEEDLKRISYNAREGEITSLFFQTIRKYLRTERMRLFVLREPQTFTQMFSSNSEEKNDTSLVLTEAAEITLLKLKRVVIRKSDLENAVEFEKSADNVAQLFAKTNAAAFIIISSNNRITALMFLDRKKNNTDYNKYDISTITYLYSYFFIFSYYMINIASKKISTVLSDGRTSVQQLVNTLTQKKERIVSEKYDVGFFTKQAAIPGGDYVDCIRVNNDRSIFVVGNISGRGIGSSVSTMLLKAAVQSIVSTTKDFKQLVVKVNKYIYSYMPKGTIFCGMFAVADFNTNDFYYVNCGIPAIHVFTKNLNKTIEVQGTGRMLGFVPDVSKLVAVRKVHLNKEDILFTYTNGIIDSKTVNGSYLKKDQIISLVQSNTTYSAERIARFIYENFSKKEEIENDVSIMVFKQKPVIPV